MRQCCFNAVDTFDEYIFERPGTLLQHRTQRHSCQFFRAAFSDFPEHCKRCPMTCRCTERMKQYTAKPKRCNNQTAYHIIRKVFVSAHQTVYDAGNNKIRCDGKGHTDDCEDNTQNILSPVFPCLSQRPRDRRRTFFFFLHKQTSFC